MSTNRYNSVLLFGAPGVGKGTQGKILNSIPGFFNLACGEVFRSLQTDTEEGREAHAYISKGELVPDELTVRVWHAAVNQHIENQDFDPNNDLLVLDGIPRSVKQAEMLEDSIKVVRIIFLYCSDDNLLVERILGRSKKENRTDDVDQSIILKRQQIYRDQTKPVLNCYPENLVSQIDAIGKPVEVLHNILSAVLSSLPE